MLPTKYTALRAHPVQCIESNTEQSFEHDLDAVISNFLCSRVGYENWQECLKVILVNLATYRKIGSVESPDNVLRPIKYLPFCSLDFSQTFPLKTLSAMSTTNKISRHLYILLATLPSYRRVNLGAESFRLTPLPNFPRRCNEHSSYNITMHAS